MAIDAARQRVGRCPRSDDAVRSSSPHRGRVRTHLYAGTRGSRCDGRSSAVEYSERFTDRGGFTGERSDGDASARGDRHGAAGRACGPESNFVVDA